MTADLRSQLQSTLGDGYVIGRELAGGGMSRVFLADETALRRAIVVKVLPPEMVAEVSVARFQREIALAAPLQHPHIVPLLRTGETNGLPYYTMPFVDGESLRDRLARGGELPVDEAVRLLREVASALAYAHDKGIVHRDIKPENILLSGGIALVTDFGVAKALLASSTSAGEELTAAGVAVGTPGYMSPEQVSADPSVDLRADIYAFGMIAYEMLAGESPFAGRRSVQALMAAQVLDTPESLRARRPSVSPALAALVMRCIEKRPADRPQHASEIVRALDALTTATHARVLSRAPNGRSRATFAIVALVVVVIGVTGWFSFRRYRGTANIVASRLLIAPFENLTGDRRFDHIGRIAADRLALLVSQVSSTDVVPPSTVLMALRDTTGGESDRLKRLSKATNAGLLVSGSVLLRGDSLTIQAQVTETATGKVVVTLDPSTGSAADPIAAIDALGDHLLGSLGTREWAILPKGMRAPRHEAYQQFAAGFERFAVQGDPLGSRPFFERAIAIDSNYAQAYILLIRQHINVGEYARADSLSRRVDKLSLSAVERLLLAYQRATLAGDIAGLLRVQQQLVARDSSPLALSLSGEAAVMMRRPDVAIPALEHAKGAYLLMGGRAALGHVSLLADAYHLMGKHDSEMRTLLDNRQVFPNVATFRARQLRALAGAAEGPAALAIADTMLRESADSAGSVLLRVGTAAQEFAAHGQPDVATRMLTLARAWMATHPARMPSPDRAMRDGSILLMSRMADSAAARFTLAARDTNRIDAAGELALALLAAGHRDRARVIADSLGSLGRPWLHGVNTLWRAAILGALGEREQAVQLLQQAHREGQSMQTWHYTSGLASLRGFSPFEAVIRAKR